MGEGNMKTIAIVATGGTIAGRGQIGKAVAYHAGEMDVNEIIQSIPMLNQVAHIKEYQLMNVDSNEMTPQRWLVLSQKINELVRQDDIDGIVVTHGTDTLDETAYFLTLTLHTSKPVVVTGAMRPATATSADGPYNLYQAVCLAAHDEARNQGVMGLFSSTIFSGRDIQKVNNYKVDAFEQKAFGCLGYMQDHEVHFFSKTFKKHTIHSLFSSFDYHDLPAVGIAYFYAGASHEILYSLALNHQGIILTGSGSGNYSQDWLHAIEDLSKRGIIFVRCSRVSQGIVFDDEVFDPHHCCIPGNTLTPQKARVLLMLALTYTHDLDKIKELFNEY
ncbi:asparaginase [Clostridium sp. C1]|nr:asparaginase [Clostridium sp. C1]